MKIVRHVQYFRNLGTLIDPKNEIIEEIQQVIDHIAV